MTTTTTLPLEVETFITMLSNQILDASILYDTFDGQKLLDLLDFVDAYEQQVVEMRDLLTLSFNRTIKSVHKKQQQILFYFVGVSQVTTDQ